MITILRVAWLPYDALDANNERREEKYTVNHANAQTNTQ